MIRLYNVLISHFHYLYLIKSQIAYIPKIEFEYKVVKKINSEKIPDKLMQIFEQINIGETITTKSFFDQYKDKLRYNSTEYAKNKISESFKIAFE